MAGRIHLEYHARDRGAADESSPREVAGRV
jgi:hypothetical protein